MNFFLEKKRFSHFTHVIAYNVWWISFSSLHLSHIFHKKKMSHEFSSSVGISPSLNLIVVSPLSKMGLKIWSENMKIWEYTLLLPQLSSHYCRAGRTCAVAARRPRMRSFAAQVAQNSARALGTYNWDKSESCDEMNSLGNWEPWF